MEKYVATIDEEFIDPDEKAGVNRITITDNPAVRIKGYAFKHSTKLETFNDESKMRIAAPILIPMEIYRRADEEDADHTITFTPEELEKIHGDMMENLTNTDFFNLEHTEEKVPAYLLEVWMVEKPKKDKSFTEYGVQVPKSTIFGVVQITDKDYFNKLVKEGKLGFSVEAFLGRKPVKLSSEEMGYADVVVINDSDEVLLLKRTENDDFEPNTYGFAGGKIEEGENPKQAAARELGEEAGIALTVDGLTHLGQIENDDNTISHYYAARYNGEVKISDEHSDSEWVAIEDFKDKDFILGDIDRFEGLAKNANQILKTKTEKMAKELTLPDGEHEINGTVYVVKGGKMTEKVKEADVEVADEEEKTEVELTEDGDKKEVDLADEEETEVELAEEDKEKTEEKTDDDKKEVELEEEGAAKPMTEAEVVAMMDAKLEEVFKAIGDVKAMIQDKEAGGDEGEEVQLTEMEVKLQKMEKLQAHINGDQ